MFHPPASRRSAVPSRFARYVEDLDFTAANMAEALRQETAPGILGIHLRREAIRACRLLLLARHAGADFLLGPFAKPPEWLRKASDGRLLGYWKLFATTWLRAARPEVFAADAGGFDFPAFKTKDGRVFGKNGKPLRVIKTPEGGGAVEGAPAQVTDDYTEEEWLGHYRALGRDWLDACRAAARLLSDRDGAPRQTPPAASLELAPGGFAYRGKVYDLIGRPQHMLKAILESHFRRCTASDLRDAIGVDDATVSYPEQVVKDAAKKLRRALVSAVTAEGLPRGNPLLSKGTGEDLTYILAMP
jgi:hypothetical protein